MTYQIVDWLMTYIECFVMLVVVTESGGRKFEEKKQAYLLLSFSLLNAILVAVCNQISAFSFITPVLSILYLTVIYIIFMASNSIQIISKNRIKVGMKYRRIYVIIAFAILIINCIIKNAVLIIYGIHLV